MNRLILRLLAHRIALALLSFVSTLAAARYLGDRRPFEQPDQPAEGPPP